MRYHLYSYMTNRWGEGLYWQREPVGHTADGYPLDADGDQIYATTNPTEWPVAVYKYTELVKEQNAFEMQNDQYKCSAPNSWGLDTVLSKNASYLD